MTGLRVISGKAKGRKLLSVPGDTTRPITDKVKEAFFNVLGADIIGASFLDLFAGTGSIGIEALSRGAAYVMFADPNRLPVETIRANLKFTNLETGAEVLRADSFELLKKPPFRAFDYIYIAPPQYRYMGKRALLSLDANPGWLSEDGWVVVQIDPVEYESLEGSETLVNLEEFDRRRYGSTVLVFYTLKSMR